MAPFCGGTGDELLMTSGPLAVPVLPYSSVAVTVTV